MSNPRPNYDHKLLSRHLFRTRRMTLAPICALFIWCISCAQNNCKDGINKQPQYGHAIKCSAQLASDLIFLNSCDKNFKTRQEAATYYVSRAWDYFYQNQFDTAMMRFNQAWLLDSLNVDIYWGYGNILGVRDRKFKESLIYFERSLKMNTSNPRLWESASTSYGQLFVETKDVRFLNKSIEYLKAALKLDAANPGTLGQLTAAYCYFNQKDSARKYLALTDKIDPNAVRPEVRKLLKKN